MNKDNYELCLGPSADWGCAFKRHTEFHITQLQASFDDIDLDCFIEHNEEGDGNWE